MVRFWWILLLYSRQWRGQDDWVFARRRADFTRIRLMYQPMTKTGMLNGKSMEFHIHFAGGRIHGWFSISEMELSSWKCAETIHELSWLWNYGTLSLKHLFLLIETRYYPKPPWHTQIAPKRLNSQWVIYIYIPTSCKIASDIELLLLNVGDPDRRHVLLRLPCLPCIGGTFWSAISPLGRQPATQSVGDSGELCRELEITLYSQIQWFITIFSVTKDLFLGRHHFC